MTTHHHIGFASPASSRALLFPFNMDKLTLALLLVFATVVSEVRGSSLAATEKSLSRVKRLDDSFESEPKVNPNEPVKESTRRSAGDSVDNSVVSDNSNVDPIKLPTVANPKHSHRRNPVHHVSKGIRPHGKSTAPGDGQYGVKTRKGVSSPEDELQEIRKGGGKPSKRLSDPVISTRSRLENKKSIQKPREHWWHRQRRLWQKRNSEYMNKNGQPMPMKRRWHELRKDVGENQKHRIHNRQPEKIDNGAVDFSSQTKSGRPTNGLRHLVARKKSQRNGVPENEEITLRNAARNFHHSQRLQTKRLSGLDDQETNEMNSAQNLVSHVKKIRKHSANKRPKSN